MMKVLLCCLYYTHFFVAGNLDFPINDQIKSLFRAQNLNPHNFSPGFDCEATPVVLVFQA